MKRFFKARPLMAMWLAMWTAMWTFATLSMGPAVAATSPAHFILTGSGYGHGVGMSQIGVQGQALEGQNATDILTYWFPGTSIVPAPINQNIRVNIAHAVNAASFSLKAVDTSTAWTVGAQSIPINSTVKFSISGKTITATVATPKEPARTLIGKAPWTINFSGLLAQTVQGKTINLRYGTVVLKVVGKKIEVTDTLSIEQYVLGISEMPSSWPAAALQAQAIASRTYALAHTTIRSACDCQVYNNTYDQVYNGYAKESEPGYGQFWIDAVTSTETDPNNALEITFEGKPISVYFFSSDGGVTQTAGDVWGTDLPYLKNVQDPWSLDIFLNPYYAHWQRVITQKDMATAFNLSDVVSVSITSRALSNAAAVITAVSSIGSSATLSVAKFKSTLRLPSSWFEIAPPGY